MFTHIDQPLFYGTKYTLLVSVYKHGYERYNMMRNDPLLCFLERCGPPDKAALTAEMNISA